MTSEEWREFEHRMTEVEQRSKSNTKRLDEVEESAKDTASLVVSIKELAMETKYMREDLNKTIKRMDELEDQDSAVLHMREDLNSVIKKVDALTDRDGESWRKFKWLLVAGLVTIVIGFIAVSVGIG